MLKKGESFIDKHLFLPIYLFIYLFNFLFTYLFIYLLAEESRLEGYYNKVAITLSYW